MARDGHETDPRRVRDGRFRSLAAAAVNVVRPSRLRKESRCLGLVEAALLHNMSEELAAAHVLGHQVDAVHLLDHLEQLQDACVVHAVEDGDLVGEPLPSGVVRDLVALEHLHRDRLARVALDGKHHLTKRALPNRLQQRVVADCAQATSARNLGAGADTLRHWPGAPAAARLQTHARSEREPPAQTRATSATASSGSCSGLPGQTPAGRIPTLYFLTRKFSAEGRMDDPFADLPPPKQSCA